MPDGHVADELQPLPTGCVENSAVRSYDIPSAQMKALLDTTQCLHHVWVMIAVLERTHMTLDVVPIRCDSNHHMTMYVAWHCLKDRFACCRTDSKCRPASAAVKD